MRTHSKAVTLLVGMYPTDTSEYVQHLTHRWFPITLLATDQCSSIGDTMWPSYNRILCSYKEKEEGFHPSQKYLPVTQVQKVRFRQHIRQAAPCGLKVMWAGGISVWIHVHASICITWRKQQGLRAMDDDWVDEVQRCRYGDKDITEWTFANWRFKYFIRRTILMH